MPGFRSTFPGLLSSLSYSTVFPIQYLILQTPTYPSYTCPVRALASLTSGNPPSNSPSCAAPSSSPSCAARAGPLHSFPLHSLVFNPNVTRTPLYLPRHLCALAASGRSTLSARLAPLY
ncbi:hypothetical protein GW17_00049443 [Ensete ventricosum]|nr:hypothetical protein GW17_00049443 [Ensete ventricosum]RZS14747.1 hypothetical protein BHM03_00046478 [Ensete ventricosum]